MNSKTDFRKKSEAAEARGELTLLNYYTPLEKLLPIVNIGVKLWKSQMSLWEYLLARLVF